MAQCRISEAQDECTIEGEGMADPRDEKGAPRHEDAALLMTIFNGPAGERASSGIELLWTYPNPPSFAELTHDHPSGSEGYLDVMGLLTVGERLGTFVKNGVLHMGLTLDLVAVAMVWRRCSGLVSDMRGQRSEPELFENFEWLAHQAESPSTN